VGMESRVFSRAEDPRSKPATADARRLGGDGDGWGPIPVAQASTREIGNLRAGEKWGEAEGEIGQIEGSSSPGHQEGCPRTGYTIGVSTPEKRRRTPARTRIRKQRHRTSPALVESLKSWTRLKAVGGG